MFGILAWHEPASQDSGRQARELLERVAQPAPTIVQLGPATLACMPAAHADGPAIHSADGLAVACEARLDQRPALCRRLDLPTSVATAELLWHAYRRWGDQLAEQVSGDFAIFVLAAGGHRLLAIRDHFGIKPVYYAEPQAATLVATRPQWLRRHPQVSNRLDELAVADFLMFHGPQDPAATVLEDVRRLPAGHTLCWQDGAKTEQRYWQVSTLANPRVTVADWPAAFAEALDHAVADRVPQAGAGLLMSGGLDSTAIAASAAARGMCSGASIHCFTVGYERLIEDQEPTFARLAAEHLQLPWHLHAVDDMPFLGADEKDEPPALPGDHLGDAMAAARERLMLAHSLVALTGLGGDLLLLPWRGFFLSVLAKGRWWRAASSFVRTWRATGQRPPMGLHTLYARRQLQRNWRQGFPTWLDDDFVQQHDLLERWRWHLLERGRLGPAQSRRPEAFRHLADPTLSYAFEGFHDGQLEFRHPFFDLRVVELALSAPSAPWCVDKHLLRQAMRGRLPEAVRARAKSPMLADPRHAMPEPLIEWWRNHLDSVPDLARFIAPAKLERELEREASCGLSYGSQNRQPLALAYWSRRSVLRFPSPSCKLF